MADWNQPTLASLYADVITILRDRDIDAARQFATDYTTGTNLPVGTKRWNATTNRWQQLNASSAWVDLTATYDINVTRLNGQLAAFYLDWANFTGIPSSFTPSTHSHLFNTSTSRLQVFSGPTATLNGQTGLLGEIYFDSSTGRLRAHDGSTVGGRVHALLSDLPTNFLATNNPSTGTALITLTGSGTVTLASTTHAFQIGASTGLNTAFGANVIQGRNNGAAADITINALGGRVGIGGAAVAGAAVAITSTTGGFLGPRLTTTQRDAIASPPVGLEIFNTTTGAKEIFTASGWQAVGRGARGGGNDDVFWENGQVVTTNYTITNGKNALSAGPITINDGVTVTVGDGEVWTVL